MRLWHWCLVSAAVLLAAGCGSAAKPSATPTTPPSKAATTTSAPPTTAVPATSAATSSPPSTAAPATSPPPTASDQDCSTAELSASVSAGNGAAGTVYYQLELHNTSKVTCLEVGWPGVSLVAAGTGAQIGAAAVRVGHPMAPLTVEPGHIVYATLGVAEAGNYAARTCRPTQAAGLRVYPPNQKAALAVAFKAQGCLEKTDKLLRIAPLMPAPPA